MQEISRKEREKQAREEDILDAAEKTFGKMGFEGALMEDIAREAQFTRKTLYQHFGNKEELLSAVILRGFKLLLASIREGIDRETSGIGQLRSMGTAYYKFFMGHMDFFGLIHYSGRVKSMGGEAQRNEFADTDNALFQIVAKAIETGKTDGSVRRDVDTPLVTASIIFTMTGFFCEFALSGKTYTEHLSIEPDKFVQYSLDLLLDTLRNRA